MITDCVATIMREVIPNDNLKMFIVLNDPYYQEDSDKGIRFWWGLRTVNTIKIRNYLFLINKENNNIGNLCAIFERYKSISEELACWNKDTLLSLLENKEIKEFLYSILDTVLCGIHYQRLRYDLISIKNEEDEKFVIFQEKENEFQRRLNEAKESWNKEKENEFQRRLNEAKESWNKEKENKKLNLDEYELFFSPDLKKVKKMMVFVEDDKEDSD